MLQGFSTSILFLLAFAFWQPASVSAQWATSGNDINNTNSGNVGIGTSAPLAKIQIVTPSYTDTPIYNWDNHFLVVGADASAGGISLSYNQSTNTGYLMSLSPNVAWRNTVINPFAGNVGIGVTAPGARLEVDANAITNTGIRVKNTYSAGAFTGIEYADNSGSVKAFSGFQPSTGEFRVNNVATGGYISFMLNGSSKMQVANNGNVGIGTTTPSKTLDVAGEMNVSGTLTAGNLIAKYQDVAEWVPSRQKLKAGTVVILDPEKSNQVIASKESYDTRVAGVISDNPGLILGEGGEGKVKVATTGRVRVRVDATRSPIKIGDLLVTSDEEGVAMKSVPVNFQGRLMHSPGTIIGKALEPLEKGKGEILVLLSLQ